MNFLLPPNSIQMHKITTILRTVTTTTNKPTVTNCNKCAKQLCKKTITINVDLKKNNQLSDDVTNGGFADIDELIGSKTYGLYEKLFKNK